MINLTPKQLRRAASIKETIEELNNELNKLAGGSTTPAKTAKPKRRMSAAGRANIRAAVKARWAKVKGSKQSTKPSAKKPRKKMSAAGRANIIAAQKARWARIKAARPADKKFKTVKPAKKKFKMSAAAKAKLSAAAKARWAKAKASGKKRL